MKIDLEVLKTEVDSELQKLEEKAFTLFCKDQISSAVKKVNSMELVLTKAKDEYDGITESSLREDYNKDSGIGCINIRQKYLDIASGKKKEGF